jgi:hypothetical protein
VWGVRPPYWPPPPPPPLPAPPCLHFRLFLARHAVCSLNKCTDSLHGTSLLCSAPANPGLVPGYLSHISHVLHCAVLPLQFRRGVEHRHSERKLIDVLTGGLVVGLSSTNHAVKTAKALSFAAGGWSGRSGPMVCRWPMSTDQSGFFSSGRIAPACARAMVVGLGKYGARSPRTGLSAMSVAAKQPQSAPERAKTAAAALFS